MIPAKVNSAIAKAGTFGGKAIDIRRSMLNIPEVGDALTPAEKTMFVATTKTTIGNSDPKKLIENISKLVKFLSIDLGIKGEIDNYLKTRFYDILTKYYSDLTLVEIKSAFEISLMGELDKYLPKNSNGEPDKSHYQSFSIEFISKILNAYRKRRNELLKKATYAIPLMPKVISKEEIFKINNESIERYYLIFLKYKYTDKLELSLLQEKILFNMLIKSDLCSDVNATIEEKEKALKEVLNNYSYSEIERSQADIIYCHGIEHRDVKINAYMIARRKKINQVFDYCIKKEIQLKTILV